MDNNRLSGFALRQKADSFQADLAALAAATIEDPIQRRETVARIRALRGRLNVWLALADGTLPRRPLAQTRPATPPDNSTNHAA